jgi:hypothetical protein
MDGLSGDPESSRFSGLSGMRSRGSAFVEGARPKPGRTADPGQVSPRSALIVVLAEHMARAAAAGDVEAAHIVHEAIGRLLGVPN